MKIRVGDFCLLDQCNINNLDISMSPIVKVVGKKGLRTYIVQDTDYVENNTAYEIDKSMLTPITGTNVVLRFPISMPIINEYDMSAIKNIIENYSNHKKQSDNDMKRLNMIYLKAKHLSDIFGIEN